MGTQLSALIVEDSASDAALVVHQLQQDGFDVFHQRVESAAAMRSALAARAWDVVLSDFNVPGFGAFPALALLHDWDADMAAGSHGAALYNSWCALIAELTLREKLGEDLYRAYTVRRETWHSQVLPRLLTERPDGWLDDDLLRSALDAAISEANGKTWGELHTLELAHPLASIPGLEPLFVAARIPHGGDEQTVSQGAFDGLTGYRPAIIASVRLVFGTVPA